MEKEMTVDHIIKGYLSHNPAAATEVANGNWVCISKSALDNVGRECWRGGAQDVKAALIEHIQTLPLDAEFSKKLVAQVNSVQDRYGL